MLRSDQENLSSSALRWSAIVLIAGPILSVFAMAHHPTAAGETTAERLASMVSVGTLGAIVHGVLIALMIAIFVGLVTFAGRLGWASVRVRAGVIAYAVGVVCMVGAALVSGFLVPNLAEQYVAASPAEMEAAMPVFRLSHAANQTLAKAGTVSMSAGIFLWSLVGLSGRELPKVVGALGLAVGGLPILGLVIGRLELDVHGMLLVILAEAVWTVAVGIWMLRSAKGAGT